MLSLLLSRQEDREEERDNALVVGIPLCRLSRTPTPLSGPTVTTATVTTRPLGMFTDKGVQAERGMIVDKEVYYLYCTVLYLIVVAVFYHIISVLFVALYYTTLQGVLSDAYQYCLFERI